MTKHEFASVIAEISVAIGKPISEGVGDMAEAERSARMNAYYKLLGDLPFDVFSIAAARVVLSHPWATFPSIAELRDAAAETIQGQVAKISSGEAWQMAWKAASRIDPEQEGSVQRACAKLPAIVIEAMKDFGIVALCQAHPEFARSQFVKIFDSLTARDHRRALLPESVKKSIASIGTREIGHDKAPAQIAGVLKQIGVQK